MKTSANLIVIGGGASGMAAAITAAQKGLDVILLEGKDRVGKKLLSTGNGRCNFSNEQMVEYCYYDADPSFVTGVLGPDPVSELVEWMKSLGIDSKTVSGRLYPCSEQASSVLDALRIRLDQLGVHVVTDAKVLYLKRGEDQMFEAQTTQSVYRAKKVILSAGSKSAPNTGSDGTGYVLARQVGLTVREPLPALTSVKLDFPYCKSWAGVRCDGSISVLTEGNMVMIDEGQLQLTSYGVSGIPAFQVSRYVSKALHRGENVEIVLSFLPGMTVEESLNYLKDRRERLKDYRAGDFLLGIVPKNLAGVLIKLAGFDRSAAAGDLDDKELQQLAQVMTSLKMRATGTGSFTQAQVCTGGADLSQFVPQTLECRSIPGLFVTGELLDVDGMCGGYNLQWAFLSGIRAGNCAAGC